MKDKWNNFSTAIRSLSATASFVEGSSLDDTVAHFVIQKLQQAQKVAIQKVVKIYNLFGFTERNIQSVWVHRNKLNKWIFKKKITENTKKNIKFYNGLVYFILVKVKRMSLRLDILQIWKHVYKICKFVIIANCKCMQQL